MAHPYGLGMRQMGTKANNNVTDDDQQQQLQQQRQPQQQQQQPPQQQPHQQQRQQQTHLQVNNSSQFSQPVDFRMKRHPELQPCVPSKDRITLTSSRRPINGSAGGSSNLAVKFNLHSKPVNKSRSRTNTAAAGPLNHTNEDRPNHPSAGQPKKCVSMTRLDQLAQPKNRNLEADLIAEGVIRRETLKPTTPPTAIIEAKEQDMTDIINREEEERRIKAEEDLKEVARREEQERQNRQLLVESILSKMNHSS